MKKVLTIMVAAAALAFTSAHATSAKIIYAKDCAKCHGRDGRGKTFMGRRLHAKDYTNPKVQKALKDADAMKAIEKGFKNKSGRLVMRPAKGLTKVEVKALVAYMRKFKK